MAKGNIVSLEEFLQTNWRQKNAEYKNLDFQAMLKEHFGFTSPVEAATFLYILSKNAPSTNLSGKSNEETRASKYLDKLPEERGGPWGLVYTNLTHLSAENLLPDNFKETVQENSGKLPETTMNQFIEIMQIKTTQRQHGGNS